MFLLQLQCIKHDASVVWPARPSSCGTTYNISSSYSSKKLFMNWVMDVVRHSDLITVFDIRREEDMDKKILFALLKSENLNFQSQMFLSMVWNRVDIAEEKVFCDRNFEWDQGDFDEVMTRALLMERVEFVELLILNGFSFRQYLTVARLRPPARSCATSMDIVSQPPAPTTPIG